MINIGGGVNKRDLFFDNVFVNVLLAGDQHQKKRGIIKTRGEGNDENGADDAGAAGAAGHRRDDSRGVAP